MGYKSRKIFLIISSGISFSSFSESSLSEEFLTGSSSEGLSSLSSDESFFDVLPFNLFFISSFNSEETRESKSFFSSPLSSAIKESISSPLALDKDLLVLF